MSLRYAVLEGGPGHMRLVLVATSAQLFELPKSQCACGMMVQYNTQPTGDCHIYRKTDRTIIGKPVFEFAPKET